MAGLDRTRACGLHVLLPFACRVQPDCPFSGSLLALPGLRGPVDARVNTFTVYPAFHIPVAGLAAEEPARSKIKFVRRESFSY